MQYGTVPMRCELLRLTPICVLPEFLENKYSSIISYSYTQPCKMARLLLTLRLETLGLGARGHSKRPLADVQVNPRSTLAMRNRFLFASQRVRLFLVSLGIVALAAPAATAALKKYNVRRTQLLHYEDSSPHVEPRDLGGGGKAVVDDSGPDPVLLKLKWFPGGGGGTSTTVVPQLSGGFIWYRANSWSGPGNNQTGTGSTASSITWGDLTDWTVTGGAFCHAIPSYICGLVPPIGTIPLDETVDPGLASSHYDVGTWVFHGTGFSHPQGYITITALPAPGNLQQFWRGAEEPDGTVPALPLLGIGAVGVSVFAMGVASVRRRRQ